MDIDTVYITHNLWPSATAIDGRNCCTQSIVVDGCLSIDSIANILPNIQCALQSKYNPTLYDSNAIDRDMSNNWCMLYRD